MVCCHEGNKIFLFFHDITFVQIEALVFAMTMEQFIWNLFSFEHYICCFDEIICIEKLQWEREYAIENSLKNKIQCMSPLSNLINF